MKQLSIKDILLDKMEDAVIWQSKKIWQTAKNPDAEVDATQNILSLVLCINDAMKRDRYVTHISNAINAVAKLRKNETKDLQQSYEFLKKQFAKNRDTSIKVQMAEVESQLALANERQLPELKEQTLRNYLKDTLKHRAQEQRIKAQKEQQLNSKIEPASIGLPEDFDGDLYAAFNYGIYEKDHKYYIRGAKDNWVNASSFVMKVHYLVRESNESSYRVITFTNHMGQERTLTINTDDMTGSGSFKKVINRMSGFGWFGKDDELNKLNEYLQRNELHALQLNTLGYNSRYRFWAWGNGILELDGHPTFNPADEYGIVTTRSGESFFLPSANKADIFSDDMDEITPEKKFIYVDSGFKFKDWSSLHRQVYEDNSIIAQLWYCASLFRDVVFSNNMIKRMPLLFAYGQPGSGKGVFINSILALNGYAQNSISLESNTSTPKGILRSFAQFKNGIVWLDEYKNAIPKNLIAMMKQLYDGASYSRAKKSNDARTESTPINASAIVSGQDMPTIEAALLERHILLQFEGKDVRPAEQLKAFEKLTTAEANGLSAIANQILQYRNHFVTFFAQNFKAANAVMKELLVPLEVKERYQMNFGILLAVYDTLSEVLSFNFTRDEVIELLVVNAQKQSALTKDNNDIAKFWSVVEFLVSQQLLIEDKNYTIDRNELVIKLQDVHPLYIKELKSRGDNFGLDKSTLENYMRSDLGLFIDYKKSRLNKMSVWAFRLNYDEIQRRYNVNLSQREESALNQLSEDEVSYMKNNDLRKPF